MSFPNVTITFADDFDQLLAALLESLQSLNRTLLDEIAAAPDLLEALKMVRKTVEENEQGVSGEDNYTYPYKVWTEAVREAIAKVEGESMSDRELLENAAKAAGIGFNAKRCPTGNPALYCPPVGWWNPLADSGDALELAVKLKLETEFGSNFVNVGSSHQGSEWHMARESGVDLYAATRRAIVRAAAEIAKAEGEKK